MGGNAIINGVRGEALYPSRVTRGMALDFYSVLLKELPEGSLVDNPNVGFSGSFATWLSHNQKTGSFGDLDIKANQEYLEAIQLALENWNHDTFKLRGTKNSATQIISIWEDLTTGTVFQADFEMVPYNDGFPDEWSVFSRAAAVEDLDFEIKGVFHKLLCRALCAPSVNSFFVKPDERVYYTNNIVFSVDRGWRYRFRPVAGDTYHQNPIVYNRNFREFFEAVGLKSLNDEEVRSFIAVANACREELSKDDQYKVFNGFVRLLWGEGAQQLSMVVRQDKESKENASKALALILNLSYNEVVRTVRDDYYDKWVSRMVAVTKPT